MTRTLNSSLFSSNRWPPPPACPHPLTSCGHVARLLCHAPTIAGTPPPPHTEATEGPHHAPSAPYTPRAARSLGRPLNKPPPWPPRPLRRPFLINAAGTTTTTPSRCCHTSAPPWTRQLWTPLTAPSPDCCIVASRGRGLNHRNKESENLRGCNMTVQIPPRPDKTRSGESVQPQASRSSIRPPNKELESPDPQ